MWPYRGGKSVLSKYYPEPRHRLIIEPFCGSARYALRHAANHEVHLNDINPMICRIWRYLVSVSRERVEAWPLPRKGQSVATLPNLCQAERDLLGFACVRASGVSPRDSPVGWAASWNEPYRTQCRVLENLELIRTWKITEGDYVDLANVEATWFVDGPYQYCQSHCAYAYADIDYDTLGRWCRSRKGQVIVCEQKGADWLPFKPLKKVRSGWQRDRTEMIWTNS